MYSSIPSRLVYIFTDATIRNLKYSKNNSKRKKGEPTYWVKTLRSFWLEPLCLNKQSARSKKTKPTKGNLPTWSTKRTLRPLQQMDRFFSGVANRYASTSKALVRVIKFRYSFTSSSPPSNELLRIKLLSAHRSDQQPIAPFYFIPSGKKTHLRGGVDSESRGKSALFQPVHH